jgi:hypothetical protein
MMSSKLRLLLFLTTASLLIWGGCSQSRGTTDAAAHQVEAVQSDRILFLTLSAQVLPGNDVPVFEIIQQQVVNGTLKAKPFQDAQAEIGGYKVTLLNIDLQELAAQFVSDPLHLHAELAQEDGKLVRQEIELRYAEVPMRFNLTSDAAYLTVSKLLEKGDFFEISRLSLLPGKN